MGPGSFIKRSKLYNFVTHNSLLTFYAKNNFILNNLSNRSEALWNLIFKSYDSVRKLNMERIEQFTHKQRKYSSTKI